MRHFIALTLAFAGVLFLFDGSQANILVIQPDGSGDLSDIQTALEVAVAGDVILLQAGVYTGTANRNLDFAGKSVAVISAGGADGCIVDCQNLGQGFLFDTSEGGGSLLSGVTVRNGTPYGIYCEDDGSPTIVGCVVRECTNGVYIGSADPRLIDCDITSNQNAGVRTGFSSRGDLIRCRIESNEGWGVDGFQADVDVVSTEVQGNGRGLVAHQNASFRLVDCVVTGNGVNGQGGGIYASEGICSIRNSTISGNRASNGGGIYVAEDGFIHMSFSVVRDNCATIGPDIYIEGSTTLMSIACSAIDLAGIVGPYALTAPCVFSDPCFCAPSDCASSPTTGGDYRVCAASPCLPGGNDCGRTIGALGQGCSTPTGLPELSAEGSGFNILITEPRPNPTADGVMMEIDATRGELLELAIFDAGGRLCAKISPVGHVGRGTVSWDGRLADGHLAEAGIYFIRALSATTEEVRHFVVVR